MSPGDLTSPHESVPGINGLTAAILGSVEVALFENLYAAYAGESKRTALAILGDPGMAEDAVHTGLLEILRQLLSGRRWHDPGDARAAVLRNVRWAALNARRTRRRRHEQLVPVPAEGILDPAAWARAEARALCEEIIAGLRPRERTALRLRYVEGLSNPEAAAQLKISRAAFESQLRRALAAARRAARSSGLMPGFVWLGGLGETLRRWRAPLSRWAWSGTRSVVCMAAAAGVAAGVVQAVHGGEVGTAGDVSSGAVRSTHAAIESVAAAETVEDTVFLDALAVQSSSASVTVLALGFGRRCNCWVIARSTDAGGSWALGRGPNVPRAAVNRLAVPRGYPGDSRIVVEGTADGRPTQLVAARLGGAFAPDNRPLCAPDQTVSCWFGAGGQAIIGGTALVAADHLLAFPRQGGILCSIDRGRSWRQSCAFP